MIELSFEAQVIIGFSVVVGLVLLIVARYVYKKIPRKPNQKKFQQKWKELQLHCKKQETWPRAVESADELLDQALKIRRYKGKKMGERIVAAQKRISDNDAVWTAHNLAKKLRENATRPPLKEAEVKQALTAFRQALRDLGALPNEQQ